MLAELTRIFLGDQDLTFMVEILFRTVIIYFYTLSLLRWIGGRSVAQLSIVEFLLVIAIGSAVGDSLFYPDVPLLPAMAAILLVVLFNKFIDLAIQRSDRLSNFFEGRPQIVVTNGQVHLHKIRSQGIGLSELHLKLRDKGVTDLAEVRYAVLEPNGVLSVLTHDKATDKLATGLFESPAVPADEFGAATDAGVRGS
ncbi:DUF421 domain-containing protein [Paracoccus sp. MBLB3053]|uniref:DUF421 domain-containing protein n=1 Tax=Paracoccus aurantius TaxID=3073814 RepID=A0ABU2HVM0_9RHOB|nr:YetF domain-containing protein [Paracoccus sp. MBLB3053]MDS9469098.1 DUF421 domain-containing protein [Paracoccus sp. MBLB3053]